MTTFALINLNVSVSCDSEIDRETLAATIGTWLTFLSEEQRTIETTNKEGKAVTIKVRTCTSAK